MNKTLKVILIILLVIVGLTFLRIVLKNFVDNSNGVDVPVSKTNVEYGLNAKQRFDYYSSGQMSDTLILIVHGGAWVTGDKSGFTEHSKFFADEGYSVVNMNYRLAPGSTYPAPLQDIKSVLEKIEKNPSEYNLNSGYETVLIGHSAGAHLSALYSVDEEDYGMPQVDKMIGLAGPYDFVVLEMAGGTAPLLDLFLDGISKEEVSPARQIEANDPTEFLLFCGDEDALVPEDQGEIFESDLKEDGVAAKYFLIEGRTHETIHNMIPSNDIVAQGILKFIGQ